MLTKISLTIVIFVFFIGWNSSPVTNTPVCTAENEQKRPQLVEDGSGGAVIIWEDSRKGSDYDIFAQRIDAAGALLWETGGISVCTAGGPQRYPQIAADGVGGFIITWYDRRNGNHHDIYAQRIDASGKVLWSPDGIAICTAAGEQYDPQLVSDGQGGAVIVWFDRRGGSNYDIYAQRIDSSGSVKWVLNGVTICSEKGDQENHRLASDGKGGAVVTWQDRRNGSDYDIYAQRIDSSGTVQWSANGASISQAKHDQREPRITSDVNGNTIITWQDKRNGSDYDIYAQRVDFFGKIQWPVNGTTICSAPNSQYDPGLVSDGKGGAIIAWQDYRKGGECNYDAFAKQTDFDVKVCTEKQLHDWNIYAQLIDAGGNTKWAANGVSICAAQVDQFKPQIVSDGRGGAIVAWRASEKESNIYAQRLTASGLVRWASKGIAVSTAKGSQLDPLLVSDGRGGAIITWHDKRSGNNFDIYSQRIRSSGRIGG